MVNTISDRSLHRAAVIKAAGFPVTIHKLCSPRCFAEYPDTAEIRQLVKLYDAGEPLSIPPKTIMTCYSWIMGQCRGLKQGTFEGGVDA